MNLPIDIAAFERAELCRDPFPFVMVPRFVRHEAIAAIDATFPPSPMSEAFRCRRFLWSRLREIHGRDPRP